MRSVDELYGTRERQVRRDSIAAGLVIGSISAALFVIVCGIALDRWQERHHAQLAAEAVARVEQRSTLLQAQLKRYEAIAALADEIDLARGR